eukprot:gene5291-3780_t
MSSKNKAAQSPRVKAHSLKATPSAKKLKKKSSSRALVDTLESVTSVEDDVDPMSSSRPLDRSITSMAEDKSMGQVMKAMTGQDVLQLQMQLAKAMDDTSILRSRLRAELEHRQVLETKITDLTEKLSEARRGLSETKGALNKVQTVASQLITKRDEREVQLQQALDQNGIYERKIAELEMHISHLSHINEQNSNSNAEKANQAWIEKEKQLEETVTEMREKLSQARKEIIRVSEEKENVEYMLEAKKRRIATLEEHIATLNGNSPDMLASTRDSLLMSMLDLTRAQTAGNSNNGNGAVGSPNLRGSVAQSTNPFAAAIASAVAAASNANGNGSGGSVDVSQFESKISSLETDNATAAASAAGPPPGSASMRNSGSRASSLRASGSVTPTSAMANLSLAPLADAARLTAANTAANMVVSPTSMAHAAQQSQPAQPQPMQAAPLVRPQSQPQQPQPQPTVTIVTPAPTVSAPSSVPQQALAEAEAQAVLREILSSRERQPRPKTVERPRSNDGVHTSSNGANRPRASTRESMDRSSARAGSSRASTRMSANMSNGGSGSGGGASGGGSGAVAPTTSSMALPVQTQTPTFGSATAAALAESTTTAAGGASGADGGRDSVRAALENTQKAYANDQLSSKPFETNVRDASSAAASVRPTLSRLASRYIKPGDDPEDAKDRLNEEKKASKKRIMDWMKSFQQEHGREPTKQERESGAGVWYKEYRQLSKVLKEMDGGSSGPGASSRASMIMPDMDDD